MSTKATYKIDLHTHSLASPDGAIRLEDYRTMLQTGRLDYIAITDHNAIEYAQRVQAELGKQIIVGEEISTTQGEIIGLYLTQAVPKGLTPAEATAAIRKQGGLVCIPHPFETVRSGINEPALNAIAERVDMVEVHNGRAVFQNRSKRAYAWAAIHGCNGVANSDSHGVSGWGKTYTVVQAEPTRQNLVSLLEDCQYATGFPGLHGLMYPKLNRLNKGRGRV